VNDDSLDLVEDKGFHLDYGFLVKQFLRVIMADVLDDFMACSE